MFFEDTFIKRRLGLVIVFLAFFGLAGFAHAAIYNASGLLGHVNPGGTLLYSAVGPNNGPDARGFYGSGETALDAVNHRLFVTDQNNGRVLVFALDSTNNFTTSTPAFVLGQSDLYSVSTVAAQNNLGYPDGLAYDTASQRLFVADGGNNRVLVFNVATSTIASGENASSVLGQANFSASSSATAQNGLNSPYSLAFDASATRLFVSDQGNNRVLAFNVATTTIANGENASSVLGQADFVSGGGNTAQNGLMTPYGIAFDPKASRLFVADGGNNRVLAFNVATTTIANGENASSVLGQADFVSGGGNTAQNGLMTPYGIAFDASSSRLFVSDNGNNRVLAFNVATTTIANGENASSVLGQADFVSGGGNTAQNGLSGPSGLSYDGTNGRLFIADQNNNRVMLFNATGTIANGENASNEIGETDAGGNPSYATGGPNGGPTAQGLNTPQGSVIDSISHRLFVADGANNRVLVYPLTASDTLATTTASYVLGQPDFISSAATTTQSGLSNPTGLGYDAANQRLFVVDQSNNRIMVFSVATGTIANGEIAAHVLGQSDFVSNGPDTTPTNLNAPYGAAYDTADEWLFVTDNSNNRVLVFDVGTSTIEDGEATLYLFGQDTDYSADSNTTPNSFASPQGVAYDGTTARLFVADSANNRVLVFDASSSTLATESSSTPPDAIHVIGQTDFVSSGANTSQNGLSGPVGLAYDGAHGRLFIGDENNDRIMVFRAASSSLADGLNASGTVGQPDFVSANFYPFSQSSTNPSWLSYDPADAQLFVADSPNRIMQYSFVHITTASLANGTTSVAYSGTIAATSSQGSVKFSLAGGSLPAGLSLASSTGVISGTPTSATTTIFIVEADDNFSTGSFFDQATYSMTIGGVSPTVSSFSASGTIVASAGTSTLSWSVTNASSVAITPGGFSTGTLVGSTNIHPTSTATYTLTATNANGTSTATTTVTVDATAPTTPTSVIATDLSTSTVSLTWASSTDSGGSGLSGYNIFRCTGGACTPSVKIATSSGASYGDSGLTASTTYRYAVSAFDGVGNVSATSSNATVTTSNGVLPVIGSFAAAPVFVAANGTSTLSWSTTGATSLSIDHGIGAVVGTSTVTGALAASTTFTLTATNANGTSTATTTVTVDATAPTTPTSVVATANGTTTISLTWASSTDSGGSGLSGYNIFRCTGGACTPSVKIATSSGASYGDSGLTPSTTYSYLISAFDGVGNISASSSVAVASTQTTSTVPTAPRSLAAIAGNTQVSLSWSAPSSTGGPSLTQYLVYDRFTGSSTFGLYATTSPAQTTSTVTSLANGQSYDFEILAQNSLGTSTASNIVSSTPFTVPGAPTSASAIAGNAQATVSFAAPGSNGGSVILYYVATSNPGGIAASSTGSPVVVGNLSNGIGYTFTVRAINAAGSSASSLVSGSVTPSGLAPTLALFTAVPALVMPGVTSTLSWSVANASSVAITPGSLSTTTLIGSFSVNPTSTTLYTLTATNVNGTSSIQATVTADGVPPSEPTGVAANAVSTSEIDLSWASSSDNTGVVGYLVYQGGSSSTLVQIATTSALTYANTGLSGATTYYYAVAAYDGAGNISPQSSSTSATTQTPSSGGGGGGSGGGGGGGGGPLTFPTATSTPTSTPGIPGSGTGPLSPLSSSTVPITPDELQILLAELKALMAQLDGMLISSLTRNLTIGSVGQDVQNLQMYLNDNGYQVAPSGVGSPGNEGTYFGARTAAALAKFQETNSLPSSGFFGPLTRAFLVATLGASSTPIIPAPAPMPAVPTTPSVSVAPASPSPSVPVSAHPRLSLGDASPDVSSVQQALIQQGYLSADAATPGTFDPATLRAVQTFQCSEGIICSGSPETTGYGSVGPTTWTDLGL